jgi:polar amino acid transport system substrate-binding protein
MVAGGLLLERPHLMPTSSRNRTLRRLAVLTAVLVLLLALIAPAGALAAGNEQFKDAQVTSIPKQGDPSTTYGGQPARFTFQIQTSSSAATMTSMVFDFPQGTDLSKATVEGVLLAGLNRSPITLKSTAAQSTLKLELDPAVGKVSKLDIRIRDVVPPSVGGVMKVTGTWAGPDAQGAFPLMTYTQKQATVWITAESWLDSQGWVQAWNSVPVLNMFLKPQLLVRAIPILFVGWLLSIALVIVAFPAAIIAGLALAFMKISKIAPVRWIAGAYVNIIRGTPLFLQMYIAFFALPLAGVQADPFVLGVIVLALNSSAYLAEIFRAGIQSISKGQFEAASSLGMTYWKSMGYVIIPQTVRRAADHDLRVHPAVQGHLDAGSGGRLRADEVRADHRREHRQRHPLR